MQSVKKIISVAISVIMILSLIACQESNNSKTPTGGANTPTTSQKNPWGGNDIETIPTAPTEAKIPPTPKPEEAPEMYGNTAGNIQNGGYYAEKDGWIYFSNYVDGGSLYKMRTDDTEQTKLSEDKIKYINVVGEWIYFSNESDGGSLYKIKTDGTDKTLLDIGKASFINVVDNWIYWCRDDGIVKMCTDGTERIELNSTKAKNMNVIGDYVYYVYNGYGHKLYKMKNDGSDNTIIIESVRNVIVVGDWIYYTPESGTSNIVGELYKIRTDGKDKKQLNTDKNYYINISDDWIYYSANTASYRIKTDGSDKTQLSDKHLQYIHIVNDWIYCIEIQTAYGGNKSNGFIKIRKGSGDD